MTYFMDLTRSHPKSEIVPEARYYIGLTQKSQGNTTAAQSTWEALYKEMPNHRAAQEAAMELGRLLRDQKDYTQAIRYFDDVASKRTDDLGAEAQIEMAETLRQSGDLEEALKNFLKVKYLFKAYPDRVAAALIQAGDCAQQLGRNDEAKRYYQEVTRSYPGTSWAKEANQKLGGGR